MGRCQSIVYKRVAWSVLWLGALVLLWGTLIMFAHQTTEWAIAWTQWLFGWTILVTYVLLWGWAISISRKPQLTLLRGATCTLTILAIFLFAELAAALGIVHWRLSLQQLTGDIQNYRWAYRHDPDLSFRRRPHDHWTGRPTSDIEYGWRMPPSLRQPLTFTYDRWGYRNPKDVEQADVALIGDSYVEGWYVSDEQTTARRLEARLGRSVANLGVAGYGTQQELLVLKRDALRVQSKVVVWFFFEGNDLYDDHGFANFLLAEPPSPKETAPHPLGMAHRQGWQHRSFTLAVLDRLRRLSDPVLPSNAPYFGRLAVPGHREHTVYFADYAAVPWSEWVANRWEKARGTLAQAAELSQARGIHVLFAFVPIKFRVYQPFLTFASDSPCREWSVWPLEHLFAEFCQSAGVPCLDLTDLFQEAVRHGGMPYAAADTHWSPEGHELVADRLATELRRRGWLPTMPLNLDKELTSWRAWPTAAPLLKYGVDFEVEERYVTRS